MNLVTNKSNTTRKTDQYSPRRLAALAILVGVLSYAMAKVGGALILRPQLVSPLWLGNVVLVAVLLLVPRKIWPLLLSAGLVGFLVYDVQAGEPIRSIVSFILSNAVEVLTASWCLNAAFKGIPRLNSLKALAKYCFYAVFLAPVVGAFLGAFAVANSYWASWRVAFFSEALGFLTLMPAILAWISERHIWMREHLTYFIEQAALLVALIFLAHLAFATPTTTSHPALLYSLVPLLLWSTLRFGTMRVSTSIIAITFLSIWEAVHGRGPFTGPGPIVNVASLQLFLFFTAAPFMTLSVLVEERKRSEDERVNERTRIARELHDTLLQSVQALLLRLQSVSNALPELPATAEAKKRLNSVIDQTEQAVTEGRDAVQGLRSSTMPNGDFAAALKTLGADLATVDGDQSPPVFHVEVEGKARELKPVIRDEVYRIAGEALRNAFRHAQAHRVEVTIRYDEQQLTLRVRDDGKGISAKTLEAKGRAGHWGLQGMRERASKMGAQMELRSRPEAGTEIELKIPAARAYQSRRSWSNWFSSRRSSNIDTQA